MKSLCKKCGRDLKHSNNYYGLHKACFQTWFGVSTDVHDLRPHNTQSATHHSRSHPLPQSLKQGGKASKSALFTKGLTHSFNHTLRADSSFYHGRYLKFSARIGPYKYILKLQEPRFRDLPAVEYACNQVAKALSLQVPLFYFIDFQNKACFVTRNFMPSGASVLHHIYKFLPAKSEAYNCTNIIKVIRKKTSSSRDVKKFIFMCLFDALIGNNDRHGRNIAFIQSPTSCTLAPMYDNPSYFGCCEASLLGVDLQPAGCVWTKDSQHPNIHNYCTEFIRLGYKKEVLQFTKKVDQKQDKIINILKTSFIGAKRKKAFLQFVQSKIQALQSVKDLKH